MPVAHVLWTEPFWGFHHTQTLGLLAWYFVDYEEGRSVGPNLCTSPPTLAVWIGFVFAAKSLLRAIAGGTKLPAPVHDAGLSGP
ncbi:MAG TPA: hypothetical protein VGN57_18610 [Pirellulaceae bacterium]|nr:hypothetical protein [Pirellulaceae bacterium]